MTQRPASGLYAWAIQRPVAVSMIVAAVCVLGVLSYDRLRVALMPELSYPTLTVRTVYEGAAPEEVEQDVTIPLEEVLRTVEDLQGITSSSRAGQSDVVMEFRWGAPMDLASQKVRERLDLVRLPDTTERPLILRYDPDLDPIVRLGLYGDTPQTTLRRFAEDEVKRALEKIEGVAMVKVHGGEEPAIYIDLDPRLMQQANLNPAQVIERLRAENINLAGGKLEDGSVEYLVRTLSEFEDLETLRDLAVGRSGDSLVRLGQVARVDRGVKERRAITRLGGTESVEIEIYKEADANLVAVAEAVKTKLFNADASLSKDLPAGIKMEMLSDRSVFIRAAVQEVSDTAYQGGILAVLVLFIFLRSAGLTGIIALAIPLSVVVTFAALYMLGISLNVMSLGGLALGVGMLVDNAVVVLESIFRCREEGDSPQDAATRGVAEVGTAVIVSTLTTVAVFFPIVFVEGVAGQLFGDLALTVVLSLLASLAVALFLVPMLAARVPDTRQAPTKGRLKQTLARLRPSLLRWESWESAKDEWGALVAAFKAARWGKLWLGPWIAASALYRVPRTLLLLVLELVLVKGVLKIIGGALLAVAAVGWGLWWLAGKILWPFGWLFDKGFGLFERAYVATLRGALHQRLLVVAAAGAGLFWAITEGQRLGVELVPTMRQGELLVDLRLPVETSLQETASKVAKIETQLGTWDGLSRVFSFMGQRDEAGQDEGGDNHAQITLTLSPGDGIAAREDDAMQRIRQVLDQQAGVTYHIRRPSLFSLKTPVAVELRSDDLALLRQTSTQTLEALTDVDGLKDLRSSLSRGYPELHVLLNREALAARQLTARDVAGSVQQQVLGQSPTRLRSQEKRVDVIVRLSRDAIHDTADLNRLTIRAGTAGGPDSPSPPSSTPLTNLPQTSSRPVSLAEVASIPRPIEGPGEIRRIEGQRVVVVEAVPDSLDLAEAMSRVEHTMHALPLPEGVRYAVTGQREELESAQRNLLLAFGLAVFLVYIVMAAQFEALVAPFVIMFSIPLAGVGVVAALLWAGATVSVVVFIGVIMLAGIVVNNAIVLIDYIIQLRDRGIPRRDAIIQACAVRLRPVLITTLTTVLGLIPMALGMGEGAEIRAPMALTVMGGLSSSTLLTLLVIPVFYDLIGEVGRRKDPPKAAQSALNAEDIHD